MPCSGSWTASTFKFSFNGLPLLDLKALKNQELIHYNNSLGSDVDKTTTRLTTLLYEPPPHKKKQTS